MTRHWLPFLCCFMISLPSFAQTTMFRGSADHRSSISTNTNVTFGEEAWKFNAQAPLRSSVACSANDIFFGTSRGEFYSLDQKTGMVKWKFITGHAINSSPALHNGNVFFADNKQTVYALNAANGKLTWKLDFGAAPEYAWAFDYFYSSPTISDNKLYIGGKDGYVYSINVANGTVNWKFKTTGAVRSSAAVKDGVLYVGSTEGILYALDTKDGRQVWQFMIAGNGMKNEDFGFDRRAIIGSPVIANDKIIVGGRDGFLYGVDKKTGKESWRADHQVSWVISSVAVKDSLVVTGTSDGRFVQAVSLHTGKEIWRYRTKNIVWSSPVIHNDKVYIGSHEGQLFCFDLFTGKRLNNFQTGGIIFTAPVIRDSLLFFGCDDGYMYALKPSRYTYPAVTGIKKFVYWETGASNYFRNGADITVKEYLAGRNYTVIDSKKLATWMSHADSAVNSVIVFATNYFPEEITKGYENSLLRSYLKNGGKVVLLGNNPLIFKYDAASKQPIAFNIPMADSVLSIKYGPNDTRAFRGNQPAFPTAEGEQWGLRKCWAAPLPLRPDQIDVVLGKDENGLASAWVKKFSAAKGSGLVQIWVNPEGESNLNFIDRVAEFGF